MILRLRDEAAHLELEEPLLRFFRIDHEADERFIMKLFGDLAATVVKQLPRSPERTIVLRKLIEALDAAIRAASDPGEPSVVIQT